MPRFLISDILLLFIIHNFSKVLLNELVFYLCIYLAIYLLDCMHARVY